MSSPPPIALSSAEFEAIQARFPPSFTGKRPTSIPLHTLIQSTRPLDASDIAIAIAHVESGASLGVNPPNVKALRHTHHRLAQFLAGGMDETIAAKLCNYTPNRVSILKGDPAFQELMAHYKSIVDDEFTDFISAAADLSLDMVGRLQQILDEEPEKLSPGTILEAIRTLADRSGNSPVQRTLNANVNVNLGDRLRSARQRANASLSPPVGD